MFIVKPVAVSIEGEGIKFDFKVINESHVKFFPEDAKVYVKSAQLTSFDGYGNFELSLVIDDEPVTDPPLDAALAEAPPVVEPDADVPPSE